MVYLIRISLFKGVQEILWRISNARLNHCNLIDLVADFTRGHQSSVQQLNLWVGASCSIASMKPLDQSPAFPDKERLGLRAPQTHKSTQPA
jgi:hypothetical protein